MGNTITVPLSQLSDTPPATQQQASPVSTGQQISVPVSQLSDAPPVSNQSGQSQPPASGLIESGIQGVKHGASDLWGQAKAMASNLKPAQTGLPIYVPSGVADAIKDLPVQFHTYEAARAQGKSPWEAYNVATQNKQATDAVVTSLKQRVKDFETNPTQAAARGIVDVAPAIASLFVPGAAEAETSEVGGAEAATAAEPATAETSTAVNGSNAGAATDALTPKAQAIAVGTAKAAKAGISEGTAETVAPPLEDIQPPLHQGIRDFVNKTAQGAGVDPIPDSTPVTDVAQQLADTLQERSQDTFDKVEQITGINPTTLKQQMAARADQITEAAASGDLEKAGKLEMLQKADENRAIQLFNQAKAEGVDVDTARADWNKSLRADELSAAVRGSKANTSTLRNPVIDPSKLAPRLQKLAEGQPGGKAPKLFQLSGQDNATALVEHAENAREATQAIKNFTPASATGQKLWAQLQANNTIEKSSSLLRGGKVVAKTDWNGVVKDIGEMTPEQRTALGDDFPRMRQLAGKLAARQNAMDWITGTTTAGKMARVAAGGALLDELARGRF